MSWFARHATLAAVAMLCACAPPAERGGEAGATSGVGTLGSELSGLYAITARQINQSACEPGGLTAAGFPMLALSLQSLPTGGDVLLAISCSDQASCQVNGGQAPGTIRYDFHERFDQPAGPDSLTGTSDQHVQAGSSCNRQIDRATLVRAADQSLHLEVRRWRSADYPLSASGSCATSTATMPDLSAPCMQLESLVANRTM